MTSRQNNLMALAAVSGLLAVGAGAFGAHAITDLKAQDWLKTGAHYQLVHAVAALVALSLAQARAVGLPSQEAPTRHQAKPSDGRNGPQDSRGSQRHGIERSGKDQAAAEEQTGHGLHPLQS